MTTHAVHAHWVLNGRDASQPLGSEPLGSEQKFGDDEANEGEEAFAAFDAEQFVAQKPPPSQPSTSSRDRVGRVVPSSSPFHRGADGESGAFNVGPVVAVKKHDDMLARQQSAQAEEKAKKEAPHYLEGVNETRHRLVAREKYIISPTNPQIGQWDMVTFAALVFTAIVTPPEVAFGTPKLDGLFVINRMIDITFGIDMVLQFFRAYNDPESGLVIKDRQRITRR
jgi:hypothetical protein